MNGLKLAVGMLVAIFLSCGAQEEKTEQKAELTGTLAFPVKEARVFARVAPNGEPDFSALIIGLAEVEYPCQHPQLSLKGPGRALGLEIRNSSDAPAKGSFSTTPDNANLLELDAEGKEPKLAQSLKGTVTVNFDVDPTQGVTGELDLASEFGETLKGTFEASYCGAY